MHAYMAIYAYYALHTQKDGQHHIYKKGTDIIIGWQTKIKSQHIACSAFYAANISLNEHYYVPDARNTSFHLLKYSHRIVMMNIGSE